MFSRNVGDEILKASLDDATLHYSVTKDSKSGAILIKLVNPQADATTASTGHQRRPRPQTHGHGDHAGRRTGRKQLD